MPFLAEVSCTIPNKDILSWMFDEPKYDLDTPIYIDAANPSKCLTGRQARTLIRKLVAGLQAAGIRKGDCVCIHSFNHLLYPILFLGIIAAGGIFAGTNPSYTSYELTHHIKTSHTRFIITEPEMLENILLAAKECNIPKSNIWIFDSLDQPIPAGLRCWRELLDHGEKDWVRFNDEKTSRETTAARLYSSGTTGLPKAAVLSHYNLIAENTLIQEYIHKPFKASRILCLPMFHASIVPLAHIAALRCGHKSYIMRRFELEPFLSACQTYKPTELVVVPPLVIAMIMSPLTKKYSLKSFKHAVCGAAPLSKESQKLMKDEHLASEAIFTQVWGMTETSCVATQLYYPESDDTGSIGRPIPNLDMKIIDEDGKDITAYDTTGELSIRGPTVTAGYFENAAANAESFDSEGYFKTGDIVYCSKENKKWYIIDRKKELIKVRAFQVAPPEIEAVLLTHPHIVDAGVIGVRLPSEPDAEYPRAYLVRRPGPESAKLTAEEVKAFCAKRLAAYKSLVGGVVFVDAIPKNASGKILKRLLRDMAKTELSQDRAKI